jgi:hypothetical protein
MQVTGWFIFHLRAAIDLRFRDDGGRRGQILDGRAICCKDYRFRAAGGT